MIKRINCLLIGLVICVLASVAQAGTPLQAKNALIAESATAGERGAQLRKLADQIDNEFWIGVMWNTVNIDEYTCYALGRMLGQDEAVKHLSYTPRLPTVSNAEEAYEARVEAQRMDNFRVSVENVLRLEPGQRSNEWDLDCVARRDIPLAKAISDSATFYTIEHDGKVARILGNVELGFSARLGKVLTSNPQLTTVALGSRGGLVTEAVKAGRIIREHRLDTVLWNNCYSACPLVFLGGVHRRVYMPWPSFGFHQFYNSRMEPAPLNSPIYDAVSSYIREMGASPQALILAIQSAKPTELSSLSGGDNLACAIGLVTWAQRSCDSNFFYGSRRDNVLP